MIKDESNGDRIKQYVDMFCNAINSDIEFFINDKKYVTFYHGQSSMFYLIDQFSRTISRYILCNINKLELEDKDKEELIIDLNHTITHGHERGTYFEKGEEKYKDNCLHRIFRNECNNDNNDDSGNSNSDSDNDSDDDEPTINQNYTLAGQLVKIKAPLDQIEPFQNRLTSVNCSLFSNSIEYGSSTTLFVITNKSIDISKWKEMLKSIPNIELYFELKNITLETVQVKLIFIYLQLLHSQPGNLVTYHIPRKKIRAFAYISTPFGYIDEELQDINQEIEEMENIDFNDYEKIDTCQARLVDVCYSYWGYKRGIRINHFNTYSNDLLTKIHNELKELV